MIWTSYCSLAYCYYSAKEHAILHVAANAYFANLFICRGICTVGAIDSGCYCAIEFLDVMFFIKCIKFPNQSFPVLKFVSFSNVNTRSSSFSKLSHQYRRTRFSQHSYFCRLTRLWNSLPPIDLTLSFNTIKSTLRNYFIDHFISHFDSTNISLPEITNQTRTFR